jgi:aminocarboxymuconate-semialdehyde decarboxylase
MKIVDFHNHFAGPGLRLATRDRIPDSQRAFWEAVNGRLASVEALLASLEAGGVSARAISTPLEFLEPGIDVRRINDAMAATVARASDRLHGLATVDAYAGEPAARELERAVRTLGLRGLFMESAQGGLLPDAPEARPALAAAASLGVPVFLHPVPDAELDARFRRLGRMGVRLTRSTINSAALYALIEGGVFEALPKLRVVVTALALGGVLLADRVPDGVHVDTTGMKTAAIRAAIDVLGADHVVLGTDWPVVQEKGLPARLEAIFDSWALETPARHAIAGGNALELLGAA